MLRRRRNVTWRRCSAVQRSPRFVEFAVLSGVEARRIDFEPERGQHGRLEALRAAAGVARHLLEPVRF